VTRRVINGAAVSICLRQARREVVVEAEEGDGTWGGRSRERVLVLVVRGGGSRRRLRTRIWRMDAANPIQSGFPWIFTMRFDASREKEGMRHRFVFASGYLGLKPGPIDCSAWAVQSLKL
jgi:hypothetical protein